TPPGWRRPLSSSRSSGPDHDELRQGEEAVLRLPRGEGRESRGGLARIASGDVERVVNAPVPNQQALELIPVSVARSAREQAQKTRTVPCGALRECANHWEGHLAAWDITVDRLTQRVLPARQIQGIIGNLKRHAPVESKGPQAIRGSGVPRDPPPRRGLWMSKDAAGAEGGTGTRRNRRGDPPPGPARPAARPRRQTDQGRADHFPTRAQHVADEFADKRIIGGQLAL